MEPRQTSAESMPQPAGANEQAPSVPNEVDFQNFEAHRDGRRNEQTERRIGQHIEGAASHLQQSQQATTLPAPMVTGQDDTAAAPAADDSPIVAADEDLIEKEWVDKAKKVIAETKDDPYRRELEVKRLQLDYVKKRYGKSIGAADDSAWEH